MPKQTVPKKEKFKLAFENYQNKNFNKAKLLCKKILLENPKHYQSLFLLGVMLAQSNKYQQAEKLLQKSIHINPNFADAHYNLGIVLNKLGEYKDSIKCYQKTLEINPNYLEALLNLGNVFQRLGQHSQAISCFQKAIKIYPHNESVHVQYNLGNVYNALGQYQTAITYYNKVIEINPNYLGALLNLGNVFQRLGQHSQAIFYFQKVIQINPIYADVYNNLAVVFRELGDQKKAISFCQKAIKIKPHFADAHNNLGVLFMETGKQQKAVSHCEKAVRYEPKNLSYTYQLSTIKKEILNSNLKFKIDKYIRSKNISKINLAYGNFLLSKYEFQAKNYKKEFNHLLKGHKYYFESEYRNFKVSVDSFLNQLPKIIDVFKLSNLTNNFKIDSNKIKPIFIVGVPRCGSTLVEKIIASSSKHIVMGEETGILINSFLKEKIPNKGNISLYLNNIKIKVLKEYQQSKLVNKNSNIVFTDKSLENFFYIGLIKIIFPNARVVNCKRDPLSSIMSILKNNLIRISWAHNLDDIFKYFDTYYQIIEYWESLFPKFVYHLQYEKLVKKPEKESKKLLQYCGLVWQKKCLEFYKRDDVISKTASSMQIRRPVYTDSLNKYLPYKKLLEKYLDKYSWFN